MKSGIRRIVSLGLALCLLMGLLAALAEDERFCSPEEVDLSQVREENGRLVGEILLPQTGAAGAHKARLLIDCPVPEPFPEAQRQKLTVEYKKVTKDMLKEAIEAVGQSTKGGTMREYVSDQLNRAAGFELEPELSSLWPRYTTNDLSGHPKQAEMLAARELIRALLRELGAEASEAFLPARRNLAEESRSYSLTGSSYAEALFEMNKKHFEAQEKKFGRNGEDDLTLVRAFYELNGLPVMFQFYWKQGGDMYGSVSSAALAMRDDGTLVQFSVEGIPIVKGSEPCAAPERSWEEMLRLWVANAHWPASCSEDVTYEDELFGGGTNYATYEVLTAMEPCWVGREKFRLEPGWYTLIERHVAKDDSLDGVSLGYVAAEDMERVF